MFFSVSGLLFRGCPSTIVGGIIPVVINPVDGVSRRSFPHILKEVAEVLPAITNFYSSSSIPFPVRAVRVGATGVHCGPSVVNFSSSESVSIRPSSCFFSGYAATTVSLSSSKPSAAYFDSFTAYAQTSVQSPVVVVLSRKSLNGKTAHRVGDWFELPFMHRDILPYQSQEDHTGSLTGPKVGE